MKLYIHQWQGCLITTPIIKTKQQSVSSTNRCFNLNSSRSHAMTKLKVIYVYFFII